MIIIKIIILYFIQIRHTDDFPSTGTRLVNINYYKSHFTNCKQRVLLINNRVSTSISNLVHQR